VNQIANSIKGRKGKLGKGKREREIERKRKRERESEKKGLGDVTS
jgi:hypothetical protein